MIWRKNRPIFSKNRPKWSPTYYLLNKRAFLPHFWALGILYWLTLLPKVAQVLGKWPNFACQINYLAQNFPYFCSIFSKKLIFLYFSLLAKVLITIKIKILTLFKKSPKMEPNFWALFLKKNRAKGFKKSPKWRKIAQSGLKRASSQLCCYFDFWNFRQLYKIK